MQNMAPTGMLRPSASGVGNHGVSPVQMTGGRVERAWFAMIERGNHGGIAPTTVAGSRVERAEVQ